MVCLVQAGAELAVMIHHGTWPRPTWPVYRVGKEKVHSTGLDIGLPHPF